MTDNFKKAWNLTIWLILLYRAFDFPVTPGLLIHLFYFAAAFLFLLVALTQITMLELISYFIIWIYSYLSNIVIALPKVEEVGTMIYGRAKRFLPNDITSFQVYGTLMVFSHQHGFLMFLVWVFSILIFSFVAKSFMHLVDGTDDFGDRIVNDGHRCRHFLLSLTCLFFLTLFYTKSIIYTVLTLMITILSNDAISCYLFSFCNRFTTFFSIAPRLDVMRLVLVSCLFCVTQAKGFLGWNFMIAVVSLMISLEYFVISFFRIKGSLMKKRKRSTSSKSLTRNELMGYSDPCPVCLGEMETAKITDCMHIFHEDCLELCLQRKPSCPVCRHILYI